MAGGTFNTTGKTRPGTYINFKGEAEYVAGAGMKGIVLLPLFGHTYGPEKEYIEIYNNNPDSAAAKLGYNLKDKSTKATLMIGEALKNAQCVLAYILKAGVKATAEIGNLRVSAKYGGSRGNSFKVAVIENAPDGYSVQVYLDSRLVFEQDGVVKISDLNISEWVDFECVNGASSDLLSTAEASAGTMLTNGSDTSETEADVVEFFTTCGSRYWNTLAFGKDGYGDMVVEKINSLRADEGKYRKAVVANFAANHEGVINVTNGVMLANNVAVEAEDAVAWVAGMDAAAESTTSLTYKPYQGAVDIIDAKDHTAAVKAIIDGEFFFSADDGMNVVVEYDINSLVDTSKPASYRKNRVIRVLDALSESIKAYFPPNKFSNNEIGWDIMEGIGNGILKEFEASNALTEVDYENDFKVDRIKSRGDSTYFNIAAKPVDSAEKLYFSITTN